MKCLTNYLEFNAMWITHSKKLHNITKYRVITSMYVYTVIFLRKIHDLLLYDISVLYFPSIFTYLCKWLAFYGFFPLSDENTIRTTSTSGYMGWVEGSAEAAGVPGGTQGNSIGDHPWRYGWQLRGLRGLQLIITWAKRNVAVERVFKIGLIVLKIYSPY